MMVVSDSAPPLFRAEYDDAFEHRPAVALGPCTVGLPAPAACTLADRHGNVPAIIGCRPASTPRLIRGLVDGVLPPRLRQRQTNADHERIVFDDIIHRPLATPISSGLQIFSAWTSTDCSDLSSRQLCKKNAHTQTHTRVRKIKQ